MRNSSAPYARTGVGDEPCRRLADVPPLGVLPQVELQEVNLRLRGFQPFLSYLDIPVQLVVVHLSGFAGGSPRLYGAIRAWAGITQPNRLSSYKETNFF